MPAVPAANGRYSRKPEIAKKRISEFGPRTTIASPTTGFNRRPVTAETWKTRMQTAANPRSESKSAKRGLPGGGASAGEGAASFGRAVLVAVTPRAGPPRAPSARRRTTPPSERLQRTSLPWARRVEVLDAARPPRQSASASASRLGSARDQVRRDRSTSRRGLVLEAVRDGQHARRGHLDRDQAGVRRVHQRQARRRARAGRRRRRPAPGEAAGRAPRRPPSSMRRSPSTVPMPFSSQPSANRPRSTARLERQHAELEHVPRGVRLGTRVEEQPARAPRGAAPRRWAARSP